MSYCVTLLPHRLLFIDVQRSVQSGLVRATSLGRSGAVLATLKLENAIFHPKATGFDLAASGAVRVSFPNSRTLHLASRPVGHSIARGLRVAQFGPAVMRLRNLPVLLDEQAVALVGEMSQSKLPGELSLTVHGQPRIARLSPQLASVPFAFPLPRSTSPAPENFPTPSPLPSRRSAAHAARPRRHDNAMP